MTIDFKVGDEIWWLDIRSIDNPKIRHNTILQIEWEKDWNKHKYVFDDDLKTYVWSPNTVVARTKEELINILCPVKVGKYELNDLVYIVKTKGNAVGIDVTNSLVIDKAYIKGININTKQYLTSDKQDNSGNTIVYPETDVYKSVEEVKQVLVEWLNNNDN